MAFDHNWDLIDFPEEILSDPKASEFSVGTATHCYGGSPEAQTKLHDHFPTKGIWLTECSGGEWQKGNLLVAQANLIIETTRNWDRVSFCGTSLSIRITRRIWVAAQTAAA